MSRWFGRGAKAGQAAPEAITLTLPQALWLAGSLCSLHRVPMAEALVAERLPPPITLGSVMALLAALGIRSQALRPGRLGDGLQPGTLVQLALNKDTAAAPADADADAAPALLLVLAVDGERVLVGALGQREPQRRNRAELLRDCSGLAYTTERSRSAVADPDAEPANGFGWAWFGQALLQHRRLWRDVLITSLVIQLLALAVPLATQAVVDKVVVHRTQSTLLALGLGLVAITVFSSLLSWLRQVLVLHTGNRIDAVLSATIFARLVRLPLRFFEHRPTGVLTARLQGIEQVREFMAGAAVTLALDVPFIFVFLAIMFWYSVPLTLVVLGALALIVALSVAVVPAFRRRLDAQFLIGARNQAFVTEHLAGIETVKSVQMEAPLQARYEDQVAQHLEATLRTRTLANSFNTAAGAIEQLMTLAILCVGAWLAMTTRDFTIGMLVAFQMFASRLSQPVMRGVGLWQQFQQTRIAVRRLADIMNVPAEAHGLLPSREPVRRGELRIEQLAFRHGEGRPWLFRGLDVVVPAGSAVALMGASGCGKSTLAKLMLGMYPAADGRILLDGHDIAQMPVNELRRSFGVVPQETMLFSGSVLDNVVLGHPHASFEQVVAACRMAEVHAVIEALPEGYQTLVGERGVGLSGGQRQRLAIARALLKRPQVLIFDEATSNLDPETAQAFARTVNALKGQVTLVFIAHQLPRALQLDAIVRLDGAPAAASAPAAAAVAPIHAIAREAT